MVKGSHSAAYSPSRTATLRLGVPPCGHALRAACRNETSRDASREARGSRGRRGLSLSFGSELRLRELRQRAGDREHEVAIGDTLGVAVHAAAIVVGGGGWSEVRAGPGAIGPATVVPVLL